MEEESPRMQTRKRKSQKEVDPLLYAGYFEDTEDVAEIERMFFLLEKKQESNVGKDDTEIARQLFVETATPKQLPLSLWYEIFEDDGGEKEFDGLFNPDHEVEDDNEFYRSSPYSGTRHRRSTGGSRPMITTATAIGHLGAGVDLWPSYKIESLDPPDSGPITHRGFPNTVEFVSREEWKKNAKKAHYHRIPKIDAHSFFQIVGKQVDLILMDPPFGHAGWDGGRFRSFITSIKPKLDRTFIVVWADPQYLATIVDAFRSADYVFCDSICVELLDELVRPYNFVDPTRFPRDSRMAIMFRTDDICRSDLKQQRVKDTGFGIIQKIGKSYKRMSMPMTIHNIVEIMLPPRKGEPRVFVELWPGFFDRRPGWILIDEIEDWSGESPDQMAKSASFDIVGDFQLEEAAETETEDDL